MAKAVVLQAEPRAEIGKSAVRAMRDAGRLPAVIYGKGIEARALAVSRHDLIRALHAHGPHPLVRLDLDGEEHLALVKEVQIDPVHRQALHVDFHRVEANKPVSTEVPVHFLGDPVGVKMGGGMLEVQLHAVAIEALPLQLPEAIEIDVSGLNLGDVARVGDLTAPAGVTILTDAEETLATVSAPRTAAQQEALEAAPVVEAEAAEAAPAEAPAAEGE